MERVRRRVVDPKTNRLIVAFLKAGILSEGNFLRSDAGSPQGGILSPLLANIALSVIEERYERHVLQRRMAPTRRDAAPPERRAREARHHDRRLGRTIVFPIRYADDFLLLVSAAPGPEQYERARQHAEKEKAVVATLLKQQLGLELSETKTLVTPVTKTFASRACSKKVSRCSRTSRWSSVSCGRRGRYGRARTATRAALRAACLAFHRGNPRDPGWRGQALAGPWATPRDRATSSAKRPRRAARFG